MDFKQSETKKTLCVPFCRGKSGEKPLYLRCGAGEKTEKMQVVEFVFRFTAKAGGGACGGFLSAFEGAFGETVHIDGGYPWIFMNPFQSFCVRQSITNMKNLTRCIRRLGIRRWRAFRRWQHPFIRLQALKKTHGDRFRIYWRKINYSSILWNVNG